MGPEKPPARTTYTWYLAASWRARETARTCRAETARRAPHWTCNADWLDIDLDEPTMAVADAYCAGSADVLVLLDPDTPTPGKLTELGIAIASGVPAYLVHLPGQSPPDDDAHRNIFERLVGPPVAWRQWIEAPFDEWRNRRYRAHVIARALNKGDLLRARKWTAPQTPLDEAARTLLAHCERRAP